jgi:hypothetical protein
VKTSLLSRLVSPSVGRRTKELRSIFVAFSKDALSQERTPETVQSNEAADKALVEDAICYIRHHTTLTGIILELSRWRKERNTHHGLGNHGNS